MSKIFDLVTSLSANPLISGMEHTMYDSSHLPNVFTEYGGEFDNVGNILLHRPSGKKNAKRILIEAHLDEIGLCVKDITKEGFISVCACGGFDLSFLPGTEFYVFGKKKIRGIACSIPPHLLKKDGESRPLTIGDIHIDCGFSNKAEAKMSVSIGDSIRFANKPIKLANEKICAPALDNKASIAALLLASEKALSDHDLYFLFAVGEETTSRGVKCAAEKIRPDIAIVVDVGFALSPDLDPSKCIEMGQGPAVSFTDTLSRDMTKWAIDVAKKHSLPLQIICEPGGTGTNATALQLQNGGIPCAVISIPLKNMHSPSEVVLERDIEKTAELLCAFAREKTFPCEEVILVGKE